MVLFQNCVWWSRPLTKMAAQLYLVLHRTPEFFKLVGPIGPRGQNIMRSDNNVGNAGPHVRQTFLNDVFTFLTEVGSTGRIVNTGNKFGQLGIRNRI